MFSAHTLHVLHVVLRDTLIVLIVLFLALFTWLKYGIHTDRLTFGKFAVEGLYIKLDKKLTLKADKIITPSSKARPSFENIDKTFDQIKYILTYFDYIELSEVDFNNNKLKFLFADNILYITTDDYEIAGNIERKGSRLVADVSLLYLKKEKVNIVGKLKYFLNKDRLETEGSFEGFNITGNFAAFKDKDLISFALKSGEFFDLKTLTDKLPLKEVIKSWMAEKIVAKEYKLHSFIGKAHVVDKKVKIDIHSLRGEAILKDVKVTYQDTLEPVYAEEVKLIYKERSLFFDLKNPVYRGRDLQGSSVSISNMKKGKIALLHLDLHVKSEIDQVVHDVLKAYKLHIPVIQKGSPCIADINLTIPLKKKYKSAKEKAKHKVKAIVDVKLGKGVVTLNKTLPLGILNGAVHYKKGTVSLHDVKLREKWYAGTVNGQIALKPKRADLKVKVDRLTLGNKKNTYFKIENKMLDVTVAYGKHQVSIPALGLQFLRQEKETVVKLSDLKKIKPYLKKMDIEMDGGHLDIRTKDFKHFSYAGILKRNSCFFYDNNKVCHTQVPCKGEVSKNTFTFLAFNNRLNIDIANAIIKVNRLNIDLKAFFKSREKVKSGHSPAGSKKLRIKGTKSKLRYNEYTLVTDSYNITVRPNGNVQAVGHLKDDTVRLSHSKHSLKVEAIRIQDQLLHPLINFNGLKGGRYTFKLHGDPKRTMYGEIIIEGGVMKDFKAYNNTLAFINTLPALATLHNPGFSKKGFTIKKGVAKYRKVGDRIIFDNIHIEGTSANFVGTGEIDLKKQTINMNMAIQTAREFGKVVGSIPLLGYILMGDDKSMTIGLKITGSLSQPKVETSASKELLKLPLDIIKRTLTSPAHIGNKRKKNRQQVPVKKETKPFNRVSP